MDKIYYDSNSNIILGECPFCGGMADFIDMYVASVQRYKLWIECDNCGAKSTSISYVKRDVEENHKDEIKQHLAELWNKRTFSKSKVLDVISKYIPDDDGTCTNAGVDLREMLDEIENMG